PNIRRTSRARCSWWMVAWSCNPRGWVPGTRCSNCLARAPRPSFRFRFRHNTPSSRDNPMADNAQKVRDIIEKELGVEREKLTDEASFIEDLGADSLDIVELVMEFEKEFNIDIPDEDAEKLRTVGDAVGYLNTKMGSNA